MRNSEVISLDDVTDTLFLQVCAGYLDGNQDHPDQRVISHAVAEALRAFVTPSPIPPYHVTGAAAGLAQLLIRTGGPTADSSSNPEQQSPSLFGCLERAIRQLLPEASPAVLYEEAWADVVQSGGSTPYARRDALDAETTRGLPPVSRRRSSPADETPIQPLPS